MEDTINIILSFVLMVFVFYTLFQSYRRHAAYRKGLSELKEKNPDVKTVDLSKKWRIFFIALAGISFGLAIFVQPVEDALIYRLLFVWMAVMCISYMFENDMRRKIHVINDGFLHEAEFYRFRSVQQCESRRFNARVKFYNGETIDVPIAIASAVTDELEAYKKRKKGKK